MAESFSRPTPPRGSPAYTERFFVRLGDAIVPGIPARHSLASRRAVGACLAHEHRRLRPQDVTDRLKFIPVATRWRHALPGSNLAMSILA